MNAVDMASLRSPPLPSGPSHYTEGWNHQQRQGNPPQGWNAEHANQAEMEQYKPEVKEDDHFYNAWQSKDEVHLIEEVRKNLCVA
jgi:hypothetical protein